MSDHPGFWVAFEEVVNLIGAKHLVHGAKSLPKNDPGLLDGLFGQTALGLSEIPGDHLLKADAHLEAGIAPEVLVREEQNLFSLGKAPFQNLLGITGGTDDPAMAAAEPFEIGG